MLDLGVAERGIKMVVSVQEISDIRNNKPHSYRLSKAVKRNNEAHDFDAFLDNAVEDVNKSRDKALRNIKARYNRNATELYQLRGMR